MKPFDQFPSETCRQIRYILTDIDDTLTVNGRLPAAVFVAMEQLKDANIRSIPITGRPAGWCDHIARMWPVDGLVGENGAFYFRYDESTRKMVRRYFKPESERRADRLKLADLKLEILKKVPGADVAADQTYREADLAIDYCEDIPPLSTEAVNQIVELFKKAGAEAKVSSIHVNGWFGEYDKLTMTRFLFEEVFHEILEDVKEDVIYIGDSPNDAPMFTYFPHSVGVANVLQFEGRMPCNPAWITRKEGGHGFAEMVDQLLALST
ncbi:MAG: HAD-IIB family hydrolase [Desulfobacterales bacterium]|nr:MAG: HAD-IIB family hydrolase [Desulfobacterales bacterium]